MARSAQLIRFRLTKRRLLDPSKLKLATPWPGVQKTIRLQLVGPLLLLCVVAAAETIAFALAHNPSSALLWYLDLGVFGIFRKSRVALSDLVNLPFAQLLIISPMGFLAMVGIALRRNLLIAISSNLTFICVGFLLFSWHHWNALGELRAASIATVHVPIGSDLCLFALLVLGCVVSFVTSHYFYVHHMRSRIS
jgi:hypothetical protein